MNNPTAEEIAKACAESMYERDTAVRAAGITVEDVKPGYAVLKMTVRSDMLNGHKVCHGGYLFILADSAFAYACNTYNQITYAHSCDIDFVRSGKEGDELFAEAVECTRGRKTGLYDVTVTRANGELVAEFRGRSYQLEGEVIQD